MKVEEIDIDKFVEVTKNEKERHFVDFNSNDDKNMMVIRFYGYNEA